MGFQRSNILMIHCHDLGQYLGCYGVKTVQTSNLDAFASSGVRFTQSFSTAPTCSPSRASLFTGRYPHNNGVMGLCHANFAWDLHGTERHLAQILKEAGYRTAAAGVVHETRSGAARCGYQEYDRPSTAATAADNAIRRLTSFRDESIHPFFLFVGFEEPHRLPHPNAETPGDNWFITPNFPLDDSLGVQVPGYLRDTPGTRRELAELQGAVRYADTHFGRLMTAVRILGLEPNTLVIFTTDHGVALPRAKCSLYDPGIQVALLLRLPSRRGWHGGGLHSSLISNIDMLPSILDLLGTPIPETVQGRSFKPLLDGDTRPTRDEIFAEMTYHDYYDPRRCIRTGRYKLILNFTTAPFFMDPSQCWRPRSDTLYPVNHAVAYHNPVELYDLQEDPWELHDISAMPEAAEIKSDLLRRLRVHLEETGDPILQGAITSPQHFAAQRLLVDE